MKEFAITVTETYQDTMMIEAETLEEALAIAEERWDDGGIELDANNFFRVEFYG